ncbi:putative membrane protein [Synechococcus sp. BIOS-U3-1]|nr:putative membrane protein [Synechococcus sp. BIOS-U3-1]
MQHSSFWSLDLLLHLAIPALAGKLLLFLASSLASYSVDFI